MLRRATLRRVVLLLVWLAVLAGCAAVLVERLRIDGDLRLFMPQARTPDQALLLQGLGEGAGSRMLLLAIENAPEQVLAELSIELATTLADDPAFAQIANGEDSGQAIPPALAHYRYLLSSAPYDAAASRGQPVFSSDSLRSALQQRLSDLRSPAASFVEPLLAADPTLETLALLQGWEPESAPEQRHGVWFSPDGERALLLASTEAGGFDPEGQRRVLDSIQDAFAEAQAELDDAQATLRISGPGAFSVLMRERTQGEATRLGLLASAGMLLLLVVAYRDWRFPLLGALPLASAALAGLTAVALAFDAVHGITLAFGITLIGVAQDYPVHLFSQQRPGLAAGRSAASIQKALALGVVSTCIAYLSFFAAGVDGLRQLAVFTIVGLLTAAVATRFLLPALLPLGRRDAADGAVTGWAQQRVDALPRPGPAIGLAMLALAVVLLATVRPAWENSLAALTPVPPDLLQADQALRQDLGAPDVRQLLVLEPVGGDDSLEALLQSAERLQPELDELVADAAIGGYDIISRYLPSAATQRQRQAQLPGRAELQQSLSSASEGLPFRSGVFAPFLDEVEQARTAAPLDLAALRDSPLAPRLDSLVGDGASGPVAMISLVDVRDAARLAAFADAAGAELHLLDLRAAAESLAAAWRERVLLALAVALLLLGATVAIALRQPARVLAVLLPMLITTALVVIVLGLLGTALTLFHLIALLLAAGLGLDYALFFDHARHDAAAQRRSLHAITICALSTLLVFGLLATSSIPVLRALGLTVALGVLFNFVLALLLSRPVPEAGIR